jgi:hypothetical protein
MLASVALKPSFPAIMAVMTKALQVLWVHPLGRHICHWLDMVNHIGKHAGMPLSLTLYAERMLTAPLKRELVPVVIIAAGMRCAPASIHRVRNFGFR